ncbi:MAG: hypothetical protein V8Q36_08730 [Anaerotignum sp.]
MRHVPPCVAEEKRLCLCRVKEVAKSGLLFCKLGISAFVNEFATGVVLTVFNLSFCPSAATQA